MGWQPGPGSSAGEGPRRDSGMPGGPPARDPRLTVFAGDGLDRGPVPSGPLALLADELSGPERRCPGASGNELAGMLRAWAAVESWAAGAKLAVIAELVRRDDTPPGTGYHGDLPDDWSPSLRHQLALSLSCSAQSAESTAWLAWELQARLPATGGLLADGTLTLAKARGVAETFRYLSDADAARAEALIAGQLASKTYPQVLRLAEQAALTVDPELAERRREQAQRKDARVSLFREQQGTAGLSGRDLPPDEALAAMASVNARAQEYEDSGVFGATRMDVLRAYAYLDLLNGVSADARVACAEAQDEAAEAAEALAWAKARAARTATEAQARTGSAGEAGDDNGPGDESEPGDPDDGEPGDDDHPRDDDDPRDGGDPGDGDGDDPDSGSPSDDRSPSDDGIPGGGISGGGIPVHDGEPGDFDGGDEPGGGSHQDDFGGPDNGGDAGGSDIGECPGPGGSGPSGPGDPRPGGPAYGPGVHSAGRALAQRPPDLAVPLATLLGLAQRPGEIQGFGMLDPALARLLAAAAAASPRTQVCVTVTSPEGYAAGHGCARPERPPGRGRQPGTPAPAGTFAGLPARLNLTIPATTLARLTSPAQRGSPWTLTPSGSPGPRNAGPSGNPGSSANGGPPGNAGPPGNPCPPGKSGRADRAGLAGRADLADEPGTGPPHANDHADGYGTWILTVPGGRRFTVRLDPVPVYDCDHRYQTRAYQPGDKLRHLVQVRDGTCTFPPCNRHAREADFEHARPYDQGGKTCACNAGARSRACHQVKQSPGWTVTQPKPGWHQWTTPAGRTYTQEPWRYPA